ncbi:putative nuclear protein SDK3 [Xylariales sp. AK1849]|nr:putative nuclear protein SDK3 [Xylariales sp. AK1849]
MSTDHDTAIETDAAPPAASVADPILEMSATQKRKASSPQPSQDASGSRSPKRSRRSEDGDRNGSARSPRPAKSPIAAPKESSADRRQDASQEERKRGKRLFGGLLSTLSQTTGSSQQKKRQEIERRQQAKASQQRAEVDKHREAKLAELSAVRKVGQVGWEEQVMQTQHSSLLASARFLQTRTEPKIFYLPWEPTEDQEDLIKDQIRDAEDLIEREVREFKQNKGQRLKALGISTKATPEPESELAPAPTAQAPDVEHAAEPAVQTVGKVDTEPLPDDPPNTETTNRISPAQTNKVGHDKESDETGDVMVEGDEDTVIY